MPFLHHKPPSSPPRLPPQTPPSHSAPESPPKGVKRIVSGLKRRISHISLRGRRISQDAHHPPLILDVPDDHHPIPVAVSPRSHHSLDTLTRTISGGGLGKHYSDSEDTESSSSGHTRSSSAASSSQAEYSQVESSPPSLPRASESAEDRRAISGLSARLPPPESLTAPIEALVLPSSQPELSIAERKSVTSCVPLTVPVESLVRVQDETAPLPAAEDGPHLEPWEVPLPPLEPCDIPLPDEGDPSTVPLPDEGDEGSDSHLDLAPPLAVGIFAATLSIQEDGSDSPSYQVPLPHFVLWDVPLSAEDLEQPPIVEEDLDSAPTPDSPLIIPMDPLGVSQPEPSAAVLEEASATLDSQLSASMNVAREIPLVSPPAPVGEPEVPNPFIANPDDSSNDTSALEDNMAHPVQEITLAPPQPTVLTPRSPNLNKSVPPTPALPSDDEDEEDIPELYLPSLTLPTMFLPIPNTDALSTLLTKYIPPEKRPPRDLTGDYARVGGEIHPLVMTNSWRAIARHARDRIVEADPEEVPYILSLWYLRLSSLARMRLFNQTSAECTNLFTVLHAIEPPETRAFLFDRVLPFELEVLYAKLKYWAGDHMGYLDALAALLNRCKSKARAAKADQAASAMWTERGSRVCLIIASQLIEMKDFAAAAKVLEPLCLQNGNITSPALRSAVARIYLQGGYIAMAAKHLAAVAEDPTADPVQKTMNAALFASAEGDWQRAITELQKVLAADPENFVAVNNLAVALLNQGKLREGIEVLENALRTSPAIIVTAEPSLFNLSTLYELRSASGADKKRELLVEVAKWAGDGLRTTCLKMPTN